MALVTLSALPGPPHSTMAQTPAPEEAPPGAIAQLPRPVAASREEALLEDTALLYHVADSAVLAGVFDGHCGAQLASTLPALFTASVDAFSRDAEPQHAHNGPQLLRRAFAAADAVTGLAPGVETCGSTATVALLQEASLTIAWAGWFPAMRA